MCAVYAKAKLNKDNMSTTPRRELAGAALAIEVAKTYSEYIDNKPVEFLTDSTTVLHYIKNLELILPKFCRNRVNDILEWTEQTQWNHVRTNENPADKLTKYKEREFELDNWFVRNTMCQKSTKQLRHGYKKISLGTTRK